MSILGSQWSVTDVAVEVFLANKVFNLVSNAVTLLGVMSVLPIEMIVSSLVSPLRACHDQVGRPEKSLLSILEKNLYPSRVEGDRRWPRSDLSMPGQVLMRHVDYQRGVFLYGVTGD
ncbi:hypothetical protein BHE74_00045005 [Ensete ventricosum]|nr:hypothetical protein BHE74_00045005 [Ensete ventricosum]